MSNKPTKLFVEFKKRFNNMSEEEILDSFNREVGNPGWTSSRASYLAALHKELDDRGYDYSDIGSKGELSLKNKVKLIGKKIVIAK